MADAERLEQIILHFEDMSDEAQSAIKRAYEIGRRDTLAQLGIEEDDLKPVNGMLPWAS